MRRLIEDVGYAVRRLRSARAFTAVAVVTLALGIAGTTMFFAAVNAMVFRPIRATHSDGLFAIRYIHKLKSSGPLTEAQFKRLEDDPPASVARIGAIIGLAVPVVVSIPGRAERVDAEVVTPAISSRSILLRRPDACSRPTTIGCRRTVWR